MVENSNQISKIWIAIGTPFQANFFSPLIKELSGEYEFLIFARNHDHIFKILDAKKIDYIAVGKHGGKELEGKLQAYAQGIQEMIPLVKREKPDLLLTERWPEAVRVAFGFNIPSWAIFYDERERHVNQMVFPLANKVFSPRFYSIEDLYHHGVADPEKVVWFNGFHTCYLKGQKFSDNNPFEKMGIKKPILLVRPEPEFAAFFPHVRPVLERAVERLVDIKTDDGRMLNVVVLPRSEDQAKRYSRLNVVVADESTIECPVAHIDIALGSAETMLMEAFTLCKPAISAIYWSESKPVTELHKYIIHSTDPVQITNSIQRYLDPSEQRVYSERARLIIESMDNPVQIMIEEIRRINIQESRKEKILIKRRSRLEIMMDIIQSTTFRPCRPTHIMKMANISYNELKLVLELLEKQGLLKAENTYTGKYYRSTTEAIQLLNDYRSIKLRLLNE